MIVFSTIMENIKSFFSREEELSNQPKAIPEAASEVYGKKAASEPPARIVEKQLPTQPPKLPFSPAELRSALKPPPQEQVQEKFAPDPVPEQKDITREIVEFEAALAKVPTKTTRPVERIIEPQQEILQSQVSPLAQSFFNEFGQFITKEDLEAEGILEKDVLWRMKEFHKHRSEGKEYYLGAKDVQQAVQRKLGELKMLEAEWFNKREQADALEKDVIIIEHEIEARTSDLKGLLMQSKAKSRLERRAPVGQEFILADGRRLSTPLDLKVALHTMSDAVFSYHVTSIKNDFAAWVRGAIGDTQLADEMGPIRDRQQLEICLGKVQ